MLSDLFRKAFKTFAFLQCRTLINLPHRLREPFEKSIYFAKILLRYDFWTNKESWAPIKTAHKHLTNLVDHSCPDIFEKNSSGENQ